MLIKSIVSEYEAAKNSLACQNGISTKWQVDNSILKMFQYLFKIQALTSHLLWESKHLSENHSDILSNTVFIPFLSIKPIHKRPQEQRKGEWGKVLLASKTKFLLYV